MGTNYYARDNECIHCGRFEDIHLGKSSGGWQFSFQYNGGKFYKNVEEMRWWLKGKHILDEYGKDVSHKYFWDMVKRKQTETNNHAEQYPNGNMVIDGYSFSDHDFS